MRFTIAIIHHNNFERLKKVVRSALSAAGNHDEIIIIDNASTDDSSNKISTLYPNINIITNNCNAGYGHCCNQAMRQGNGKYFLLCNNDIVLPEYCLDQFEELFENDSKAGMIGPQLLTQEGNKMNSYGDSPTIFSQLDLIGRLTSKKIATDYSEVGTLRGACLAISRVMTEELGMYDEDFYFYHEETEWCVRIKREGWKVMFAPEIRVHHVGGASTSNVYAGSRIEFFRSRILFWKKVFPFYQALVLFLWNFPKLIIDCSFYFTWHSFHFKANSKQAFANVFRNYNVSNDRYF